jgi:hypothetical protein
MTLLFLIALIPAIAGVVRLLQGDILVGVLLLVIACAIGPGGWSVTR